MSSIRSGLAYLPAIGIVVGGLVGFLVGLAIESNPLALILGAGFGLVVGAGVSAMVGRRPGAQ
jgi:F0F1-type ATP synthase assembly protein I